MSSGANWANIVISDLDRVFHKAAVCEICRVKLGLYFSFLRLNFVHLFLKWEYSIRVLIRDAARFGGLDGQFLSRPPDGLCG
jgi:hypothetical protein